MTANQIAYQRMLEEKRAHRVTEQETHRANVAKEYENARSNTISEKHKSAQITLGQQELAEVNRHNLVTEDLANKKFIADTVIGSVNAVGNLGKAAGSILRGVPDVGAYSLFV